MSSRLLILFSLVLSVGAVYLYKYRDRVEQPKQSFDARFDYSAEGIKSLQTDKNGQVVLSLTADKLAHNIEKDTLQLDNIAVVQKKYDKQDSTSAAASNELSFTAKYGLWDRPNDTFSLRSSVKIIRSTAKNTQKQTFETDRVIYHITDKHLNTNHPVVFRDGQSVIKASALQANLATGVYNFNALEAQYMQK